jgi:adenosylmethionine-8-amino-7-oxononanoate aminotransferase
VALTGGLLPKVFLTDSGSVAVEVAIKMLVQYWHALGAPRSRLLTIRGGYHGDTFGAMAVCDPVNGMHRTFRGMVADHVFAPIPPAGFDAPVDEGWLAAVRRSFDERSSELAGVIVAPIV